MILIQDGSQPPNIDKPLRIIGDPYKVQVLWKTLQKVLVFVPLCNSYHVICAFFFFSKQKKWLMKFFEKGIMRVLGTEMNMDRGWEEVALM